MFTFQDQYQMAQEISGDYSAAGLVLFKRDINDGGAHFLNRLGRKFNKGYKTTNLVASQQYYQFPMDVLRISDVAITIGSFVYNPQLITSEEEWILLNQTVITSDYPMYYFIRGFNEIGIYPVPASSQANGLKVSFEPQHILLTQADFTTGTVSVTNDSVAITHSGTGFTPSMVGRMFQVTDGTDGNWYRISAYVSSSVLNLENYYQGITGTATFRTGEVMKLPQSYHDAPVYYALDKYYIRRGNADDAADFLLRFDRKVESAKKTYGRSTSHMGVRSTKVRRYRPWVDAPPAVTYP